MKFLIAWADVDGDGFDEAIFTSGDTLIVRNFNDTSKSSEVWIEYPTQLSIGMDLQTSYFRRRRR